MLASDSQVPLTLAIKVISSLILSIAGATALTNYVDRDIDIIMERTKMRPLPSSKIDAPSKALYFGVILILLSLIFAFKVNLLFVVFLILGIINSVFIYNYLTKRRSFLNILLASPTGIMPILGGWSAVKSISLTPILMSILIIIWIPIHVWSIVLRWRNDFIKAKIPMLPLRIGGSKLIAFFSLLMAIVSCVILPFILKSWFIFYLIMYPLNVVLIILSIWLTIKPTEKNAWILFKFTSPYIAIIFTLWALVSCF